MAFGIRPKISEEVTAGCCQGKVSEYAAHCQALAQCGEHHAQCAGGGTGGADALSLVNTFTGLAIDIERRRPILANNTGGVSGAGIKPIAVRMVYRGGTCGQDSRHRHGRESPAPRTRWNSSWRVQPPYQVGTQNFTDTRACPKIIAGLNEWCDSHKVARVARSHRHPSAQRIRRISGKKRITHKRRTVC